MTILPFMVMLLILAIIIAIPIVLFWWWLRLRKIAKQIPINIQEKINENEEKIKEVLNARKKEEGRFSEEELKEPSGGEGRETLEGSPDTTRRDTDNEDKESVKERQGIQIPATSEPERKKRAVKLHKPTAI